MRRKAGIPVFGIVISFLFKPNPFKDPQKNNLQQEKLSF
jgi:hypothetical protein